MSHTEKFHLAGVMGYPVLHSRSPLIHGYWLKKYGLAGAYVPLEIYPANLEKALRALPNLGFSGCNLTIPLKELAMKIVDHVDESARHVGAGNCCVVEPNGSLTLYNTDVFGFFANVQEAQPLWKPTAGPSLVLGAGGAARAVITGLLDRNAPEVRVTNRTLERAQHLRDEFGNRVVVVPWSERNAAMAGASFLVNTTSLGMINQLPLDVALEDLPTDAVVSDVVYMPQMTGLLSAAKKRGNPIVGGLGMLLHQARPSFRDWWGIMPDVTTELRSRIEATL